MKTPKSSFFEEAWLWRLTPFMLTFLLIAVVLGVKKILQIGVNSDSLYLYCVYQDVFENGYSFSHWNLSPAPCFFPDMAVYFPLLAILPDPGYAYAAYGVIYLLIAGAGLFLVFSEFQPNMRLSLYYALLTIFGFAALQLTPGGHLIDEFTYVPGRHAGLILPGLFIVWLWIRCLKGVCGRLGIAALFVLCLLTSASDISVIPQFIAPLCLASAALSLFRQAPLHRFAAPVVLSLSGAVMGYILVKLFNDWGLLSVPLIEIGEMKGERPIMESLIAFARSMGFYAIWIRPDALIIMVTVLVCSIWLIRRFWNRPGEEASAYLFWIWFVLFMVACSGAAPIAAGVWHSYAEVRYLLPVFLIGLALGASMLAVCSAEAPQWLKLGVPALLVIMFTARAAPGLYSFRLANIQMPYPAMIEEIDNLIEERGFEYGYAEYWNANYFNALTRSDARINQLHEKVVPYLWINSTDAYLGDSYPHYEFILPFGLERERLVSQIGGAVETIGEGRSEIWVYNRADDLAFRHLIRYFFIDGYEQPGAFKPSHPYELSQYSPAGSPWNSPTHVILEPGQSADAYFPVGTIADVVEVSLDSSEEFEISIYERGHSEPFAQTVIASRRLTEGMQIHFYDLPDQMRGKSLERVSIRSTSGYSRHAVGHVYLYQETRPDPR